MKSTDTSMQYRAYQYGLGQQLETPEYVIKRIPDHARWGYNTLVLYLEGAFRYPSHPEIGEGQAWTPAQMAKVVKTASAVGMKVIPVVPALGHTYYVTRHLTHRHLSESREQKGEDGHPLASGQVCPSLDETYALFADLFRDVAPYCTAGYLHVGLDESFDLGKCSRCGKRIAGKDGKGRLFLEHLQRLNGIVTQLGLRMAVWGDMFYYFPGIIAGIPKDVAVFDWYYYPFKRYPRVEMFNFHEVDSARRLRQAGLEVWGCSNVGSFFRELTVRYDACLQNTVDWWRYGNERDCRGLLLTSWLDPHIGAELKTLGNAAAADLWLKPGADSPARMLANGLTRMFGPGAKTAVSVLAAQEKFPVVGYWAWRIFGKTLSLMGTLEPANAMKPTLAALAAARRKAEASPAIPVVVRDTAVVREYYGFKEQLARAGSRLLLDARQAAGEDPVCFRRALAALGKMLADCEQRVPAARAAAQRLWRTSRPRGLACSLAALIAADRLRYRDLRRFLAQAQRRPASILGSCDLLPRRQLVFTVRNSHPCYQVLQVQAAADGGEFSVVHGLSMCEFTGDAGMPDADFVHRHAVPLPESFNAAQRIQVRLICLGLGAIDVAEPRLAVGGEELTPVGVGERQGRTSGAQRLCGTGWACIGGRPPRAGFPDLAIEMKPHHWVTVEFAIP